MAYNVLFTTRSKKQFSKLSKNIQTKILHYLEAKVQLDPFSFGKNLSGNKKGFWRYIVGDYRIICQINNNNITVLILDVGHRREIYK